MTFPHGVCNLLATRGVRTRQYERDTRIERVLAAVDVIEGRVTVQGKGIRVVAEAQFSADMSATLAEYFPAYAVNGVVTVEVTNHGLWLVNPLGGRQFLGLAKLPSDPNEIN